MFDLRKTISAILLAVGGLLLLMGCWAPVFYLLPDPSVSENPRAFATLTFLAGGLLGGCLVWIGWRFRVYEAEGPRPTPIWGFAVFGLFALLLVSLLATTWPDLPIEVRTILVGLTAVFVGGPIVVWLRERPRDRG